MNIEFFLKKLQIKKCDKIIVTSNIIKILSKFKKNEINFDPNKLINILKKKIGKEGTLLIPTFNWDFLKGKTYDYYNSASQAGALGNIALKRKDFLRTFNPVYSYAVSGKDKKKICNIKHTNCFSLNSPFGYLLKNKGKNLFIDMNQTDFDKTYFNGFPFHHVVEQNVKVPYRFIKEFRGYYIKNKKMKKLVKIKFYARVLKFKHRVFVTKKLENELKNKNFLKNEVFQGINLDIIDLKNTFNILKKDLKNKKKFFVKVY